MLILTLCSCFDDADGNILAGKIMVETPAEQARKSLISLIGGLTTEQKIQIQDYEAENPRFIDEESEQTDDEEDEDLVENCNHRKILLKRKRIKEQLLRKVRLRLINSSDH